MPGGAHENMRGWSPEEDELLLQLIEDKGKRWKLIAEALGDSNQRTPAMVRNRFLRIERGRFLTENGMSKNRCGQCGQLKRGHVCQAARPAVSTADLNQQRLSHNRLGIMSPLQSPATVASPGTSSEGVRGMGGLTLVPLPNEEGAMSLASPGVSFAVSSGASPGILTLGGLGTPALGPPTLRPQNSMEILAQTAMSIEHMKAKMEASEEVEAARAAAAAERASAEQQLSAALATSSSSSTLTAMSPPAAPLGTPGGKAAAFEAAEAMMLVDSEQSSAAALTAAASDAVDGAEDGSCAASSSSSTESDSAMDSASNATQSAHEEEEAELSSLATAAAADGAAAAEGESHYLDAARAKVTPPPTEAQLERMQASEGMTTASLDAIPSTECVHHNRRESLAVEA